MDVKKILGGYISGLLALPIELALFGGSVFIDVLGGFFPESAARLSQALDNVAVINFIINLLVGITAALNIGGMRDFAFSFLAGVLTMIISFGGLLSAYAPQVLADLWGDFFTVLLPIVIIFASAIVIRIYQNRQEYYGGYY